MVYGGELCIWYGMTFSSDSSCADVQLPRDRAIHLCERLEACQTRNGELQLLIEDNLNRDYEMGMQRDIDGRELLGRSDAEGDVTVREVVGGGRRCQLVDMSAISRDSRFRGERMASASELQIASELRTQIQIQM